ncbi:cytochrome P450 [Armillaria fumosa]|nr:cytochrome P450 [Armillaria fumosa]
MAELLGRQNNVGMTYYGERLKRLRKALHKSLNLRTLSASWGSLLDTNSLELCSSLSQSPKQWNVILESKIQELIVLFSYGHKPNVEYIKLAKTVMHQTGVAFQPGRWAVNFLPALKWVPAWFPGAGFQRWAQESRRLFFEVTRQPFYHLKNEIMMGNACPMSFTRQNLESLPGNHTTEDEDIIMFASGSLFSAGTETLTAVCLVFLALMASHPEVQERAFDEIQTKIGPKRLPNLQDRDTLPFIDCIIQEVHRMYPPVPLVVHSNTQEEQYGDYRIPKKAWVLANTWAMLHDEDVYFDPERFFPGRFEGSDPAPDPPTCTIHPGRLYRRCPGLHFADLYIYLLVSRIIMLFRILPATQEGESIRSVLEFTAGLVAFPKAVACRLVPRSSSSDLLAKSK